MLVSRGVTVPRKSDAPHYSGTYRSRAKKVRDQANADPTTRCWRCGRTLAQHRPGDTWDAGHIIDGDPNSRLAPEAASCNRSAGATARTHPERTEPRSKQWDI